MVSTTVTLTLRRREDALAAKRWLQEHLEPEHANDLTRSWCVPFAPPVVLRFNVTCDEAEAVEAVRRALAGSPVRAEKIETNERCT